MLFRSENMEWNILCFHNRWKELTKEDYQYMFKNTRPETKGFNPWWNYTDYTDSIAVYNTNDKEKPGQESIEYVDKISNDLENVLDDKNKLYAWLDKLVQDKKKSEGELESEN